ncbi:MAG: Ig-like domain-containing protein [Lachnospiraceae bacterium]|nr:Ig-like domain-containing protein [Lachnospiraceae bacterium]
MKRSYRNWNKRLTAFAAGVLIAGAQIAGVCPGFPKAEGPGAVFKPLIAGAATFRSGITQGTDSLNHDDRVYFGTTPESGFDYKKDDPDRAVPIWKVFYDDLSSGPVLRADQYWAEIAFDEDGAANTGQSHVNAWQGSDAQVWCGSLCDAVFSDGEKGAIDDQNGYDNHNDPVFKLTPEGGSEEYGWDTLQWSQDKVFFLSAKQVYDEICSSTPDSLLNDTGAANDTSGYWLGSAWSYTNNGTDYRVGAIVPDVDEKYKIAAVSTTQKKHALPAFRLNPSAVQFVSPAVDGKKSGSIGKDALTAVPKRSTDDLKLTLLDDGSLFSAGNGHADFSAELKDYDGSLVTFSYTGAKVGDNEYISAVIKSNPVNNNIKYYGRIVKPTASAGTAEIDLTDKYDRNAGDELYVFAEQYNGDKKTDYSSQLVNLSVNTFVTVDSVSLWTGRDRIKPGEKTGLQCTVNPGNANNTAVTYSSSNPSVATVDESGLVTGVGVGTATIKVTTVSGKKTASCDITVEPVPVDRVEIQGPPPELKLGEAAKLTALVFPDNATDRRLKWQVKDPSVASVDGEGNIKALGAGETEITVTAEDPSSHGASHSVLLKVKTDVTSVTLDKTSLTMYAGSSTTLKAGLQPAGALDKGIFWKSSNPGAVSVDENGRLTVLDSGEAEITVYAGFGGKLTDMNGNPLDPDGLPDIIKASCQVNVAPFDPSMMSSIPLYQEHPYTGSEQSLLGKGVKIKGGTLTCALGTDNESLPADDKFSKGVPTATGTGTYYVWCKITPQSGSKKHMETDQTESIFCVTSVITPSDITEPPKEDDPESGSDDTGDPEPTTPLEEGEEFMSEEDRESYVPPTEVTKDIEEPVTINLGTDEEGEPVSAEISAPSTYRQSVYYAGRKIKPKADLGYHLDLSGISEQITFKEDCELSDEELFKISFTYYNCTNVSRLKKASFYPKISIKSKAKKAMTSKEYKKLKKMVKSINTALKKKKNRCEFTINPLPVTELSPRVRAKFKRNGELKVNSKGKLSGSNLKGVYVTLPGNTKPTKIGSTMRSLDYPVLNEDGTYTVKLHGMGNFTGTAVVRITD